MNVKNTVLGEEETESLRTSPKTIGGTSSTSFNNLNSLKAPSASSANLSNNSKQTQEQPSSSLGNGGEKTNELKFPGITSPRTLAQYLILGIRRKSIKIILCLIVFLAVFVLSSMFLVSAAYGSYYSEDPCTVSRKQREFLEKNPRLSPKLKRGEPLPKVKIINDFKKKNLPKKKKRLFINNGKRKKFQMVLIRRGTINLKNYSPNQVGLKRFYFD